MKLRSLNDSWTAQKIGPIVFNYGTKEKNWKLSTAELLQYPEGSLGKEMGQFLKKNRIEPLANAEYRKKTTTAYNLNANLSYTIAKNITFRSTIGYDINNFLDRQFFDSITSFSTNQGRFPPSARILIPGSLGLEFRMDLLSR